MTGDDVDEFVIEGDEEYKRAPYKKFKNSEL